MRGLFHFPIILYLTKPCPVLSCPSLACLSTPRLTRPRHTMIYFPPMFFVRTCAKWLTSQRMMYDIDNPVFSDVSSRTFFVCVSILMFNFVSFMAHILRPMYTFCQVSVYRTIYPLNPPRNGYN